MSPQLLYITVWILTNRGVGHLIESAFLNDTSWILSSVMQNGYMLHKFVKYDPLSIAPFAFSPRSSPALTEIYIVSCTLALHI